MTYAHIWEYVRRRTEDPDRAHTYAREIFCIENGIPKEQEHLVNEEMFSYFEADLEQRGQEMVSKPRNRRFPTKLPNGFALLAIAYGTGRNDYLAVVLGFEPNNGKLVTWSVNYDIGPQKNDEAACGSGHYFDYRDAESMPDPEDIAEASGPRYERMARQKTLERAWADFFSRSTVLLRNAVDWKAADIKVVA
jgi:hypothetical protein